MNKTILLIGSKLEQRLALDRVFDSGCQLVAVSDGRQAEDWLTSRIPDFIIIDPAGLDDGGFELVSLLQSNDRFAHVPVVFSAADNHREKALTGLIEKQPADTVNPLKADSLPLAEATEIIDAFAPAVLTIRYQNSSAADLAIGQPPASCGYDRDTFIKGVTEESFNLVDPADRPLRQRQCDQLAKGNIEKADLSFRLLTKTGQAVWIVERVRRFSSEAQSGYIALYLDDTAAHIRQAENEKLQRQTDILRLVAEHSARLIYYYDFKSGIINAMDPAHCRQLHQAVRYTNMPTSIIEAGYIAPDSRQALIDFFALMKADCDYSEVKIHSRDSQQQEVWLDLHYSLLKDVRQQSYGAVISVADITSQHLRDLAYARYLQNVSRNDSEDILYVEADISNDTVDSCGGRMAVQLKKENQSGYTRLMAGLTALYPSADPKKEIISFLAAKTLRQDYQAGRLKSEQQWQIKAADGSLHWLGAAVQMITDPYTANIKAFIVISDITSSKKEELSVRRQAETDGLTGLYNRVTAQALVNRLLNQQNATGMFIIADLDNLKRINDSYGHDYGDRALVALAAAIKGQFRDSDIVARLGGDEFIAYLPGMKATATLQKAVSHLTVRLKEFVWPAAAGHDVLSCSVGAARCRPGDDFISLYQRADRALYYAKGRGKHKLAVYTAEMEKKSGPAGK